MNLSPREKDKLLISMAAMVARRRLERGVIYVRGEESAEMFTQDSRRGCR